MKSRSKNEEEEVEEEAEEEQEQEQENRTQVLHITVRANWLPHSFIGNGAPLPTHPQELQEDILPEDLVSQTSTKCGTWCGIRVC